MDKTKLTAELEELLGGEKFIGDKMAGKFLQRIKESSLTKHENPKSHFCAYFAAYDPKAEEIF
ncbi:MAG: hypothetical protein ACD_7C00567G0001 [uncultured bacterium]|nr:MAG: hypothetical protein ACD_7C00567G0001 [uncultured bacterium]